jgi:hypothetical protein
MRAATIAKTTGADNSRVKETHRLLADWLAAEARTTAYSLSRIGETA